MFIPNRRAVKLTLDLMESGQKRARDLRRGEVPVHVPDERVAAFALAYLDAYGYLPAALRTWDDIRLSDVTAAVRRFQAAFELRRTATLDVRTVRAMAAPRCGMADLDCRQGEAGRAVRAAAASGMRGWVSGRALTYRIDRRPPYVPKGVFAEVVAHAFLRWTELARPYLRAEPAARGREPDVLVTCGRGPQSHFDGPGGTLAWVAADGPHIRLVLDADEEWVTDHGPRGFYLPGVVAHEVGHVFNLDHSRHPTALMAPYYNPMVACPQPTDDAARLLDAVGRNLT